MILNYIMEKACLILIFQPKESESFPKTIFLIPTSLEPDGVSL